MTFYAAIVFLSAFLLFQIQPMIAKYIPPSFGGTPAITSRTSLRPADTDRIRLWTYDYSNIFQVLR